MWSIFWVARLGEIKKKCRHAFANFCIGLFVTRFLSALGNGHWTNLSCDPRTAYSDPNNIHLLLRRLGRSHPLTSALFTPGDFSDSSGKPRESAFSQDPVLFCTSYIHLVCIKGVSRSVELNSSLLCFSSLTLSCPAVEGDAVKKHRMERKGGWGGSGAELKYSFMFWFLFSFLTLKSSIMVFMWDCGTK